jgi:hypothetical protein
VTSLVMCLAWDRLASGTNAMTAATCLACQSSIFRIFICRACFPDVAPSNRNACGPVVYHAMTFTPDLVSCSDSISCCLMLV